MFTIDFDTIVIGNGLFGSAAGRHLALLGERVAVVGPDEPSDPTQHNGVFASHYDQGRLTRRIDRNPAWAGINRRAIENYVLLEEASGVGFFSPVGALIVGEDLSYERALARDSGIAHTFYPPGDRSWSSLFPHVDFPHNHGVIHEPAPAGFINPRRLIHAQNVVAISHGATIIREVATGVHSTNDGVSVTLPEQNIRAAKVLIAAGAFSNFNDLLPDRLPLIVKTEVVALGEVSPDDGEERRSVPTVKYLLDDPVLEGAYMTPPMRYPDGKYYIKLGANTTQDRTLDRLEDVQAWFRSGDSDSLVPDFDRVMRTLWPGTDIRSVRTNRCVLCRTESRDPIIRKVDHAIFVATGANGAGAKGSDSWGELAAGLVHDGRWPDGIPRFTI